MVMVRTVLKNPDRKLINQNARFRLENCLPYNKKRFEVVVDDNDVDFFVAVIWVKKMLFLVMA